MRRIIVTANGPASTPWMLSVRAQARLWPMVRDGLIALLITALFTIVANAAVL